MNVIIFGATGMVGHGVLRECLLAEDVVHVYVVGRTPTGQKHAKLVELLHDDFSDFRPLAPAISHVDACFYCMGVSSAGKSEAEYTKLTYEFALSAAHALHLHNPKLTFVYVSGAGTDSSEHGRSMWARVKGRTENALFNVQFAHAYMFRPGVIRPLHGAISKTPRIAGLYTLMGPLMPLLRALFPSSVTTTEEMGRAMLNAARGHAQAPILEARDIIALARA